MERRSRHFARLDWERRLRKIKTLRRRYDQTGDKVYVWAAQKDPDALEAVTGLRDLDYIPGADDGEPSREQAREMEGYAYLFDNHS